MNPENAEISPKHSSALQALAFSNIKEGMGQNVTRAQELQEEPAQRRTSFLQDSAEAQALKGQEALLAEIVEGEMAHQTQVSVLSHLHLQQAEIKAQSEEIKRLSTLLERQHTILEQVQEQQQSNVSEVPRVPTTSKLNELQREAFDILLGTLNSRHRTGIEHLSGWRQNIPVAGKAYFEGELAEETIWGLHHPHHVCFGSGQKGGLTSTPLKSSVKVGEDNTFLPQQRRARESLMNAAMCPPGYKMHMAVQEFCKMHELKINRLKGGYSATANLIFQ